MKSCNLKILNQKMILTTGMNPRASLDTNSAQRGGLLHPPLVAGLFDL